MNNTETPKRVIRLEISNIKRVSAVEIIPGPNSVILSGKNDAGKSTCLDSIEWALSGGKSIQEIPLRRGAKSGYIVVDLGDIIVERTFTQSGTNLTIKTKDGVKLARPQDLLDSLCSKVSFDPLAFVRLKPAEQAEMLRKLVGLDFTQLNIDKKAKYDERTVVNRQLVMKEAQLKNISVVADAPDAEVSIGDLVTKLREARDHNKKIDDVDDAIVDSDREVIDLRGDISNLQAQIEVLKKKVSDKEEALKNALTFSGQKRAELETLKRIDTAAIETEMANVEGINNKFRQKQQRENVESEVTSLRNQADTLTTDIENIESFKNDQVSKAKFPIEGLSFDEIGVMLNGLPFAQGSQARQLQAAIAIGIALNPTVRVILVKDASLLDAASLEMVKQMAEKHEVQCWLEIVDSQDPAAVIIEDGRVRGA